MGGEGVGWETAGGMGKVGGKGKRTEGVLVAWKREKDGGVPVERNTDAS